jgi:UDP-galactopyranose mutase
MSRFALERRVFFFEEPVFGPGPARLDVQRSPEGVWVAVPHLPVEGRAGPASEQEVTELQRELLDELIVTHHIHHPVVWYYTPMALPFSRHLRPRAAVYDCMDDLSGFKGAHPALLRREAELFGRASVVFTGGHHLFEAKRGLHPNVYPFPSSVDVPHFARARSPQADPADQAGIPRPRIGFCGVVDERMDLPLLEGVARDRPEWQLVVIGPVVKISADSLPRRPNLHYLGGKRSEELPAYFAGWDVAMMPFARNEATRFISPTKTPEYLAAGRPVVSTSIRDVVRPYGEKGLVQIGDTVEAFVRGVERCRSHDRTAWLARVDAHLCSLSWDDTWRRMKSLLDAAAERAASPGPRSIAAAPL